MQIQKLLLLTLMSQCNIVYMMHGGQGLANLFEAEQKQRAYRPLLQAVAEGTRLSFELSNEIVEYYDAHEHVYTVFSPDRIYDIVIAGNNIIHATQGLLVCTTMGTDCNGIVSRKFHTKKGGAHRLALLGEDRIAAGSINGDISIISIGDSGFQGENLLAQGARGVELRRLFHLSSKRLAAITACNCERTTALSIWDYHSNKEALRSKVKDVEHATEVDNDRLAIVYSASPNISIVHASDPHQLLQTLTSPYKKSYLASAPIKLANGQLLAEYDSPSYPNTNYIFWNINPEGVTQKELSIPPSCIVSGSHRKVSLCPYSNTIAFFPYTDRQAIDIVDMQTGQHKQRFSHPIIRARENQKPVRIMMLHNFLIAAWRREIFVLARHGAVTEKVSSSDLATTWKSNIN